MKQVLFALAFAGILGSLASALVFICVLVAWKLDYIRPTGIAAGA